MQQDDCGEEHQQPRDEAQTECRKKFGGYYLWRLGMVETAQSVPLAATAERHAGDERTHEQKEQTDSTRDDVDVAALVGVVEHLHLRHDHVLRSRTGLHHQFALPLLDEPFGVRGTHGGLVVGAVHEDL